MPASSEASGGAGAGLRVLILGGGFGGRYAARRLAIRLPAGSSITLVDRNPYLLYTPMLTEVAAGAVRSRDVVAPSKGMRRVRFVQGEIAAVDLKTKTVTMAGGEVLTADHVVVALGSTTNFRKVPGAEAHSLTMKTLQDAEALKAKALALLEQAARTEDGAERERLLTFTVAGGGYTGVESMAAMREFLVGAAPRYGIRPEALRLVMIEPTPRLMAEMPETLGAYGKEVLERDGVEIRVGSGVKSVEADSLELTDGRRLPFGLLLWDTGIVPNALVRAMGAPVGKHGGLVTDSCFRVQGMPGVWALGDCAETPDPNNPGKTFAPTAQNGTRAGTHVADNIIQVLRGRPVRPFTYKQVGELALVSEHDGVAHVFGMNVRGPLAWLMWRVIYVAKMPGMPQRLGLLRDYLGRRPGLAR